MCFVHLFTLELEVGRRPGKRAQDQYTTRLKIVRACVMCTCVRIHELLFILSSIILFVAPHFNGYESLLLLHLCSPKFSLTFTWLENLVIDDDCPKNMLSKKRKKGQIFAPNSFYSIKYPSKVAMEILGIVLVSFISRNSIIYSYML